MSEIRMERYTQITQFIYEAIDGMSKPPAKSPDTVLSGESGKLDSLAFVNLVILVEEKVARTFNKEISVIDEMMALERDQWTVATLARCVADLVEDVSEEQGHV